MSTKVVVVVVQHAACHRLLLHAAHCCNGETGRGSIVELFGVSRERLLFLVSLVHAVVASPTTTTLPERPPTFQGTPLFPNTLLEGNAAESRRRMGQQR